MGAVESASVSDAGRRVVGAGSRPPLNSVVAKSKSRTDPEIPAFSDDAGFVGVQRLAEY
jgi:hypothetical protein